VVKLATILSLAGLATMALLAAGCDRSPSSPTPVPRPAPASDSTGSSTCTFTVSDAPAGGVPAAIGEFAVSVTAPENCAWTATSSASFIALSGAKSGTGSGTVTFTVAANAGASRQGAVQVAGRTLTILQAAGGAGETVPDPLPVAVLSYQSDPGDYIGQGEETTFHLTGSDFQATVEQSESTLHFAIPYNAGVWWNLDLKSPGGTLAPGVYNNATRYPFQLAGVPGLSFSGSGRGCNQLTGRFLVAEAVYAGTEVQRFHARFEQHCEGYSAALHGQIWIDASGAPPPPLHEFPPPPSGDTTFFSYVSTPGDYVGAGHAATLTLAGMNAIARQEEFRAGVSITLRSTGTLGSFWSLGFGAASGTSLQPGTYTGATRYPFNSGVPGLAVGGEGRGCNRLTGSFVVHEARYGPSNEVLRFHATFEQHCEGSNPALLGEIRIVADPWR